LLGFCNRQLSIARTGNCRPNQDLLRPMHRSTGTNLDGKRLAFWNNRIRW
jgi:hypothetical protein